MGRYEVKLPDEGKTVMVNKPRADMQDEYLDKVMELTKASEEEMGAKYKEFRAYRRTLIPKICKDITMEQVGKLTLDDLDAVLAPWEKSVRSFMGQDFISASIKQQLSDQTKSSGQSKKE